MASKSEVQEPPFNEEKVVEKPDVSKDDKDDSDQTQYPGGLAVALIMVSLLLALFIVALVNSSPAILLLR